MRCNIIGHSSNLWFWLFLMLSFGFMQAEFISIPGENLWRMTSRIGECTDATFSKVCLLSDDTLSIADVLCSKLELFDLSLIEEIAENAKSILEDVMDLATSIESICDKILTTMEQIDSVSDEIAEDISQLDVIINIAKEEIIEAVCSKQEILQEDLLSVSDVLCSKLEKIEDEVGECETTQVSIGDVLCSKQEILQEGLLSVSDVLCSKLENIELDIALVEEVLCSKNELLQEDLFSVSDVICSKFNGNGNSTYCDPIVSIYNTLIADSRDPIINVNFQYEIGGPNLLQSTADTGNIDFMNSLAIVSTGIGSAGEATIESLRNLRYRAGHESYALFSAIFFDGGSADSTQWIGLFDDADGLAVGYNGTTFSILYRNSSSGGLVDTIIPQASFNVDPLDGTGPSGFVLDTTTLNVFRISYGWLGTSPLKFQILDENGCWITFHIIRLPNSIATPSFSNPILPMRMEVINDGNTTNLRIGSASWTAGNVAFSYDRAGYRRFSIASTPKDVPSSGEEHLLTIQNKLIFSGIPNKIELRITIFSAGAITSNSANMLIRVRKNATVTNLSFTDVDTTSSIVEFSNAGDYTANTGTAELTISSTSSVNGLPILLLSQFDHELELFPGESYTITAESFGGNINDVLAMISWEERF